LTEEIVRYREMGITHAEFFRLLPRLAPAADVSHAADRIGISLANGRAEVLLGEESERRIGNMRLPVAPLEFRFFGMKPAEVDVFMARFDLTFRKGGG